MKAISLTDDNWTHGYTVSDLKQAEDRFGFTFPPDLRALLLDRRPIKGHDWTDLEQMQSAFD